MNNTQYKKIKLSEFIKILQNKYKETGEKEVVIELDDYYFYYKEIICNKNSNYMYIVVE